MKSLLPCALILLYVLSTCAQTTPPAAKPAFKLVFEKAYLHTDRDAYAQGDTLYFKAYLLNAQDNTPATSSGSLHVEFISPEAKAINTALIRLDNGSGNGDLAIADTLAPGTYRLRAYTNWMRNFGDNFIFEKEITIIGTAPGAITAAPAKGITAANTITRAAVTATAAAKPVIRFYPEGGSMVEGVNSMIAVKAEDGVGRGINISGAVLSSAGDTITSFNCDTLGMGLFAILPLKGVNYHAVTKTGGQQQLFNLPAALSKGITLQIRQTDSLMRVVISSSADPSSLAVKPTYMLTVKHSGITLLNQPIQLIAQQIPVRIPTVSLPTGICAVTLYDENNKPNCERLVYIRQLNNAANAVVTLNKKSYQPKEQVTVQINTRADASLSMAVVDAGVIPQQADDMLSYVLLGSEIRGNIEHAHRYFDTTNVNRYKQLDLLLMTQGWRDFVWRRLADTTIHISYAAEYNLQVQGKVTEKNSDKPLPGANVSLRADMAVGNKLLTTVTDTAGRFYFNNILQYGSGPVVLTARDAAGKDAGRIVIDSGRTTLLQGRPYLPVQYPSYALLTDRAEKQKAAASVTKLKEVKVKAVNYIQLRDTRLTTMGYEDETFTPGPADKQTTIREYILSVSKQARMENESSANAGKSGDQLRVNRMVFYADGETHDPRLIVNGYELPTSNYSSDDEIIKTNLYNQYFDLPLDKAVKIVIKRGLTPPKIGAPKHAFSTLAGSATQSVVVPGETVFVIYLTLKPGAMDAERGNVAQLQLNGFYQARTFFKPSNPKAADIRTTIHWEPNIKTDAAGKATVSFNNSSATQGRVIVQGITNTGLPVAVTASYGGK